MNMDDLLEQLDESLDGGIKIPGKRTVIDTEKIRAIIFIKTKKQNKSLSKPTRIIRKKLAFGFKRPIRCRSIRTNSLS